MSKFQLILDEVMSFFALLAAIVLTVVFVKTLPQSPLPKNYIITKEYVTKYHWVNQSTKEISVDEFDSVASARSNAWENFEKTTINNEK
jgi:hypothetical protein